MHGLTQSWTRLQTRCVMFPTGHQAPLQFVPHSKPATLPKNLDKKTLLLLLRVPLGGSGCIQWSGRAETGMCDKLCQRHLEDYQQTEIAFYASAVLDTLHPVEITFMYSHLRLPHCFSLSEQKSSVKQAAVSRSATLDFIAADCKCGRNSIDSINIFTFISWPIRFSVPWHSLAHLSVYLHVFLAKVWLSCHSLLMALFCNARHWKCRIARIVLVRKGLHTPVPPSKLASDVCMWKKTYCFTSSFTTQNKIKNLPFVSSTTLIWTHKQVTGLDRSYTTKVAASKILGLLFQVTSEGFGKSPSEYDDSPVGLSMPHFGQTCVHWLGHHPAGWEKENIRKPCDLHFALQSLQSTANIYMR